MGITDDAVQVHDFEVGWAPNRKAKLWCLFAILPPPLSISKTLLGMEIRHFLFFFGRLVKEKTCVCMVFGLFLCRQNQKKPLDQ